MFLGYTKDLSFAVTVLLNAPYTNLKINVIFYFKYVGIQVVSIKHLIIQYDCLINTESHKQYVFAKT